MPVDHETYKRVSAAISFALKRGWDPTELLGNQQLLMTPARIKALQVEAVQDLLAELVVWRPAELIRRKFLPHHSASPADMYGCIVEFIEEYIAHKKGNK